MDVTTNDAGPEDQGARFIRCDSAAPPLDEFGRFDLMPYR
jgi:hypothetical protein